MKTMSKDKMGFPFQGIGREQYLSCFAKAEIQNAIVSVVSGESGKTTKRFEWTGYPDMTKCWKCGSTHLSMIENKFQDKAMVWCLDCGKTWLERSFK